MDAGLLIIRLVVGLLLVGHGAQKLLGWFDGPGLAATARSFAAAGFAPGSMTALLAGGGELASGLSLAVGLLTPIGGAALVGVMVNAASMHWPNGLWITAKGCEYTLVLGAVGAGLTLTGAGRYSVDEVVGWTDWSTPRAVVALVAGLVSGSLTLAWRFRVLARAAR